jgi:hypothetical protein
MLGISIAAQPSSKDLAGNGQGVLDGTALASAVTATLCREGPFIPSKAGLICRRPSRQRHELREPSPAQGRLEENWAVA